MCCALSPSLSAAAAAVAATAAGMMECQRSKREEEDSEGPIPRIQGGRSCWMETETDPAAHQTHQRSSAAWWYEVEAPTYSTACVAKRCEAAGTLC